MKSINNPIAKPVYFHLMGCFGNHCESKELCACRQLLWWSCFSQYPFTMPSLFTINCGVPAHTVSRILQEPPSLARVLLTCSSQSSYFLWWLLWSKSQTMVLCLSILHLNNVGCILNLLHEMIAGPIAFMFCTIFKETLGGRLDISEF